MIQVTKVSFEGNPQGVLKATEKAAYKTTGHAAASISKAAKASIVTSKKPGPAGKPPHTKRGQLRRAIRYDNNREEQSAVIGPIASAVGISGAIHEYGEIRGGVDFDERPFMRPALEDNLSRFAGSFEGTIAA